jgi:hypothetical protein
VPVSSSEEICGQRGIILEEGEGEGERQRPLSHFAASTTRRRHSERQNTSLLRSLGQVLRPEPNRFGEGVRKSAALRGSQASGGCYWLQPSTRSKNVAAERGQSEQSEGHDRPRTPARKYLRVIGKTSEGPPVTFAFEAAKFPFRSSEHLHSQNVSFLIPEGRFSPSLTFAEFYRWWWPFY